MCISGKNVRGSGHKDSAHGNWNSSINKGNAGGGGLAGGSGLGGGININRTNNGKYNRFTKSTCGCSKARF